MKSIQLLVVDDHRLFRRGLTALLSQDGRFHVVDQFQHITALRARPGHEIIRVAIADRHSPHLRSTQIGLLDQFGGRGTGAIFENMPRTGIAHRLIGFFHDPELLHAARQFGGRFALELKGGREDHQLIEAALAIGEAQLLGAALLNLPFVSHHHCGACPLANVAFMAARIAMQRAADGARDADERLQPAESLAHGRRNHVAQLRAAAGDHLSALNGDRPEGGRCEMNDEAMHTLIANQQIRPATKDPHRQRCRARSPHELGQFRALTDDAVTRMDEILEGLLSFARLGAATLERLDVLPLLRDALRATWRGFSSKQVTLDAPDGTTLVARADREHVRFALGALARHVAETIEPRGALAIAVEPQATLLFSYRESGAITHLRGAANAQDSSLPLALLLVRGALGRVGGDVEIALEGTAVSIRLRLSPP